VVQALGPVDVRERDGRGGVLEEWRRLNPQGDQGDQGEEYAVHREIRDQGEVIRVLRGIEKIRE
jgi:hypothetical protein